MQALSKVKYIEDEPKKYIYIWYVDISSIKLGHVTEQPDKGLTKNDSRFLRIKQYLTPGGGGGFRVNLEPPGAQGTANQEK